MSDPIYEAQAYEIAKMARSISALEAENAKLVDVLHEVEAEAVYAYHCLQQDCVTIANSTEHFFKKWWHAECECDRLKAENARLREQGARLFDKTLELVTENAKLRELVRNMHSELVSCEDNGYVCGGHKFDYCVSELGIEVD